MQELAYDNFINTIKSKESRVTYHYNLQQFMKFLGITNPELLLNIEVEQSIKEYIISFRDKVSPATLHNRIASIYHFYDMNDIVINKRKISKFKAEFRRVRIDRAYTHEEIAKILEVADLRMKVCIFLMASGGLRKGALPDLRIRNLEGNKLTVYENANEEYFTFVTPECSNYIKQYIEYRKRTGEEINPESYLIRNHFDDYTISKKASGVTKYTIHTIFYHTLRKSGISGNVQMTHGFRKFFTTQLVQSKVNPEIREMLLGHKIGLASCYYLPTTEQMYEEYEKAIDSLTTNEENRLRRKVEVLTIEKSRLDRIEEKMLKMEEMYQK
jgi:integrase